MTAELLQRFCAAWEALGGRAYTAGSAAEARAIVQSIAAERQADEVVAWADPVLAALDLAAALPRLHLPGDDPAAFRAACARAPVGITSAHLAVADTGTLLLQFGPTRPRSVSVLPPTWVAVVPASRLVAGRVELFRYLSGLARQGAVPAEMGLFTGPSRTADIENVLLRGVHGPGDVHCVFLLGE